LDTNVSSQRFKSNIEFLGATYSDFIYNLNPVSFNYIGQEDYPLKNIGLIAKEVEPIYSDMCIYDDTNELLTVDYSRLSILLLYQIKKLNDRISVLENNN
jgi:hypothetical protein